jgi:hypothetical protein
MECHEVAVGVLEGQMGSEWSRSNITNDPDALLLQALTKSLNVRYGEPKGDAPAELRGRGKVDQRFPNRERDWLRLEEHGARGALLHRSETKLFGIELAGPADILDL